MCLTLNLSIWMSCPSFDSQWKCNYGASQEGHAQSAAAHKAHPGEQRSCVLRKGLHRHPFDLQRKGH